MKQVVVYTAISKGYDTLAETPELWRNEADFVAFTENPIKGNDWEIRPLHRRFRDPCRNAKIHKILAHRYFPDVKYSLWVDGSIVIKSPMTLKVWIEEYLSQYDLALFKHRSRNCIYVEAAHCIACGVDSPGTIKRQVEKYRQEGYPANNGLAECPVLFRRHTSKMKELNELWYNEIKAHSRRDQISFNYAAYRLGFQYAHLPGHALNNMHFIRRPHADATKSPARSKKIAI